MTPRAVVLSYGVPRSGTTLIQKMLEQGTGYLHQKLSEFHPFHPMNSEDGLRDLVGAFADKAVVVVRTTRPFLECWESMQVAKEMGQTGHDWTREEFKELYVLEKQRFDRFLGLHAEWGARQIDFAAVTVEYKAFSDDDQRTVVLTRIARKLSNPEVNRCIWSTYLDKVWMQKPVNVGRLMQEVGAP